MPDSEAGQGPGRQQSPIPACHAGSYMFLSQLTVLLSLALCLYLSVSLSPLPYLPSPSLTLSASIPPASFSFLVSLFPDLSVFLSPTLLPHIEPSHSHLSVYSASPRLSTQPHSDSIPSLPFSSILGPAWGREGLHGSLTKSLFATSLLCRRMGCWGGGACCLSVGRSQQL